MDKLIAALTPVQIGKLPEFAHRTVSDQSPHSPYRALAILELPEPPEDKEWIAAFRANSFIRQMFAEAKAARAKVEAIPGLDNAAVRLDPFAPKGGHKAERLWNFAREYVQSGNVVKAIQRARIQNPMYRTAVWADKLLADPAVQELVAIAEASAAIMQDIVDHMRKAPFK
ncbi:hypothetical protein [Sandarakinorhabdus limnophila]|uniref:hypothetical protein n=1 Tax=Sandarakinorhabdus limnophila TaxID=210512 RepID=UPI0026EEE8BE|nr:hypothetical protein [Sandarakinorhabdus limnophila]MCM0032767.1 hypothetical protein [Sandarakinorhabdus limnophila]